MGSNFKVLCRNPLTVSTFLPKVWVSGKPSNVALLLLCHRAGCAAHLSRPIRVFGGSGFEVFRCRVEGSDQG